MHLKKIPQVVGGQKAANGGKRRALGTLGRRPPARCSPCGWPRSPHRPRCRRPRWCSPAPLGLRVHWVRGHRDLPANLATFPKDAKSNNQPSPVNGNRPKKNRSATKNSLSGKTAPAHDNCLEVRPDFWLGTKARPQIFATQKKLETGPSEGGAPLIIHFVLT